MQVHLVDGTYELYRQHFGQAVRHSKPAPFSATIGVLNSTIQLLADGATHVGIAMDHTIESFRNDLYGGYKTSEGMEPEILEQIPVVADALEALGFVVWRMERFEADEVMRSKRDGSFLTVWEACRGGSSTRRLRALIEEEKARIWHQVPCARGRVCVCPCLRAFPMRARVGVSRCLAMPCLWFFGACTALGERCVGVGVRLRACACVTVWVPLRAPHPVFRIACA